MQFDLPPRIASQRNDTLRRLIQSRQALAEEFSLLMTECERVAASRADASRP